MVDSYKEELQKLRDDCCDADLSYIDEWAAQKYYSAVFLLEQISNFNHVRPSWSEDAIRHVIVLGHTSTKSYEHMRKEGILKLPCRNTLQNYLATASGEIRLYSLIKACPKAKTEQVKVKSQGKASVQ